jgi:SAM-dependent methyltransferase
MIDSASIAAIYDTLVDAYVVRDTGARRLYLDALELAELAAVPIDGKSVLDLGCGVGRVAGFLGARAGSYCGVDLSSQMVAAARRRRGTGSGRSFLCADALHLPFRDREFDLVTCIGLYEYVEDLAPHLAEARRVLAPDGAFVFTCHTVYGATKANARADGYRRAGHEAHAVAGAVARAGFAIVSLRPAFRLPPRIVVGVLHLGSSFGARILVCLDHAAGRSRATAGMARELVVVARADAVG